MDQATPTAARRSCARMHRIASTRAENLRSSASLDRPFSPSGTTNNDKTATIMPKRTQAHRAARKTAGAPCAYTTASKSAREGGSNQPNHRKQSRVVGQSGSMYVDRATFIDDQFCKYMDVHSEVTLVLRNDMQKMVPVLNVERQKCYCLALQNDGR